MLSCRQVKEHVADLLDGAGATGTCRPDVSGHLRRCDDCLSHAARAQRSRRLGPTAPVEPLSQPARNALLAAYRRWARG